MVDKKKYLITGSSGFIGFHLAKKLLKLGLDVVGLDNHNDYYDVNLKLDRKKYLSGLKVEGNFNFIEGDLVDRSLLRDTFKNFKPDIVINLAAQAGVRYSLKNPHVYLKSNIEGFLNLIEESKDACVEHLVYASTSSVYGASTAMPFNEEGNTDHPIQFYAVTKKANELTAHAYSSLYNLPTTGLRFFTVYGPWGRPDMSLFLFTKNILEGKPISLYNNGDHVRSFTYVDDLVDTILKVSMDVSSPDKLWNSDKPNSSSSLAPYRILNIGNPQPIKLLDFISAIENSLGIESIKKLMPLQKGDIRATEASNKLIEDKYGQQEYTTIEEGVESFVQWFIKYYKH